MPVSIRAIGILARRAVPDLPDRQRHFAGGTLSSRPRRAPLEPTGGRPAPAFEGPGPAQAQADRRSRDAQAAADVLDNVAKPLMVFVHTVPRTALRRPKNTRMADC